MTKCPCCGDPMYEFQENADGTISVFLPNERGDLIHLGTASTLSAAERIADDHAASAARALH
jgi:hypothetical protein